MSNSRLPVIASIVLAAIVARVSTFNGADALAAIRQEGFHKNVEDPQSGSSLVLSRRYRSGMPSTLLPSFFIGMLAVAFAIVYCFIQLRDQKEKITHGIRPRYLGDEEDSCTVRLHMRYSGAGWLRLQSIGKEEAL